MFRLRPEVLRPALLRGVARRCVQWWRGRNRPPVLAYAADAESLRQTLLQHRGQSLHLLLSSHLSLQWLGERPAGQTAGEKISPAALQAWLRQQWMPYYGDAVLGWPLAAWRDETLVGGCALSGLSLAEVLQAAARERVHLHAIQPWWVHSLSCLSQQLPALMQADQALLVLVEGVIATGLRCRSGRLRQIVTRRLAAPTMVALVDVLQQLQRQMFDTEPQATWLAGFGLQPGDGSVLGTAQWVGDLTAPQPLLGPRFAAKAMPAPSFAVKAMPALYFMAPARRYPSWVWLGLGLLALGIGALSSHWLTQREALQQAQAAQQVQQQRNARLSQQLRALTSPEAGGASAGVGAGATVSARAAQAAPGKDAQAAPGKDSAAAERAARKAAWRLAQEWRAHWQQVLLPLEQALPEAGALGWLALEHVAAQGELRMTGAAQAQEAMLGAVRSLSEQPGWSRVMLTRITPPGGAAANHAMNSAMNSATNSAGHSSTWSFDLTARVQHTDFIDIFEGSLAKVRP